MIIQPELIREILTHTQEQIKKYCPPLPGDVENTRKPAAVLIPLFLDQGIWKMLFIKRTQIENDRHSGQIAFPGGRADQRDSSLLETALRETEEEIGIKPADVKILGQACSITTVTDYEITPYVGILPWPYPLQLSKIEVEKILLIPIVWLMDKKNYQVKKWKSPARPDKGIPVIFYNDFEGEMLWGATAQIVVDFLELIQEI
jgi:8-oxo-dGTP pyrophosphatase MutT (NUDIX family)